MRNRKLYSPLSLAALLLSLGLGACSRTTTPPSSLETARLAIQEATRYEAPHYAPAELSLAEDKLRLAENESDRRNFDKARRLGEQATEDARYAQTKAQAERAQITAIETQNTAHTLTHAR